MAAKQNIMTTVLAVSALLMAAFGAAQDIPVDKVYTEIQKTLITGSRGILTCRFRGAPYAVYWLKGYDSWEAPIIITWTSQEKTGPGYEDGSCDVDENYSLIIKNVTNMDSGRYICMVSNQVGTLIDNHTDVTVTDIAVKTKLHVSFQLGQTGILPCKVNILPKKVSWVRNSNETLVFMELARDIQEGHGPGYEEELYNITKEYALVIKDVTIQHEDRYFCEVTDFDTDATYRDFSVLTVFAHPKAPFPTVEGCPLEDHSNCIITTDSSVMLTCHVNEYYPDINLFFMHGSKNVESDDIKTWNNTDGTKNKSITIFADKSRDAYKCTASGIPGLGPYDEIWASVRLFQEQRISLIITVLFVPIVICLAGVLLTWMKLRKRGQRLSKEDEYMEDHISFAELWQLAEFITNLERDKVVCLIKSLNGNEELPTDMNRNYYYQELCRWKEANVQTVKQRTALYEEFSKVGVDELLKQLEGFRKDILAEVPTYDLEHILWQIAERQKIQEFLENLGVKIPTEKIPMERKLTEMKLNERKSFIEEAVEQLVSWTNANLTYNPVVILSSTLEQMEMCTADDNFFQLPNEEKEGLQDKDIQRTMRVLTKNHCEKLEKIIKASGARSEIMSTKIAVENNKVLFDTEKMLGDWVENVACSNYDKRRKLENVLQESSKCNESTVSSYKGSGPWISDEELKIISRFLDSASMASLCEKLCISTLPEDADEKGRFKTLRVWREFVTESEWVPMYGHLRNALGEVGSLGLLAPLKDKPIHRAEYVDIALTLLMTDVIPAARALGINDNKLLAYRHIFEPTHLKKGTIGLVAQLHDLVESTKKDNARLELSSRLREAGFPLAIERNMLVHRMAYGELHAISEEMKKCHCEQRKNNDNHGDENPPGVGDSLLGKDNTSVTKESPVDALQEKQTMAKRHINEIKKMLKLSDMMDEDRAECLNPKECDDELAWLIIWKERPRLAVFNERAAIIQGIFDMQRDDIARSVAEGNYYNTEMSLPFLQYIVKNMNTDEILRLAEVFKLKKEVEGAKDTDDFAHVASGIIHGSIRKNKTGKIKVLKAKEYKPLIDKLVENGFLDIAQELIIIQK